MKLQTLLQGTHRCVWAFLLLPLLADPARAQSDPKIHIAFLWHMHQPIYWPGETVVQTDANARFPFSVIDVHVTRTGPYTTWPSDAIAAAQEFPFAGAQVSFSGSLIRNLDALAAAGYGSFAQWSSPWTQWSNTLTAGGNSRLDLVAFGDHHPLMPLIAPDDVASQIAAHRQTLVTRLGAPVSKGIFPPENAVHPRIFAPLVSEGIEWVLVDNIHFDRAVRGYPYSTSGNLVEPNRAEQRNADPGDWVSLNGLWAPTPISAAWGHRPHRVRWTDPDSGVSTEIVAVPTSRYLGNEDGRGGFGALDYEGVLSQLEPFNTDPAHPILVVLHHDGDNYGGGSDSYYHANFDAFVNWLRANPSRFEATTVQDYLDRFPPAIDDVIHIEPGSWSGADNGDPEFAKWLGGPDALGVSPDRNSWAVLVAARNRIRQAEALAPGSAAVENARAAIHNAQASDYWYWDGSLAGVWDSQPTRAAELALTALGNLLEGAVDPVGPEIFSPQREPYNPGATEWGVTQDRVFEVWTLVDDASGVQSVTLRVREDLDGVIDIGDVDNHIEAGGPGVGSWTELPMVGVDLPPATTDPLPSVRARRYSASVDVPANTLLDYRVRAVDAEGNTSWSDIEHVWVGAGTSGGTGVSFTPPNPGPDDVLEIRVGQTTRSARLHWGVDDFQLPPAAVWPLGTVLFDGTGPAVETPFIVEGDEQVVRLGPFGSFAPGSLDFVLHFDDGGWDNNDGQDWSIVFAGATTPPWTLDGHLESGVDTIVGGAGTTLHVAREGRWLYLATEVALGSSEDVFLVVCAEDASAAPAPWAKTGTALETVAFVGSESSNGWAGWFDAAASAAVASGAVLEARIDVPAEFGGSWPHQVRVAALRYGSADGGSLVAHAPDGNGDAHLTLDETWPVSLGVTDVSDVPDVPEVAARARVVLHHPVPNPFNPRTTLSFELREETDVDLALFDARGRRVARLEARRLGAGSHVRVIEAGGLASGVYRAQLRAFGQTHSVPLVLVR